MAGAAQAATTFDSPTQAGEASTMTQGQPNQLTTNSPFPDGSHTRILGAGPSTMTTETHVTTYSTPMTSVPPYVYVGPMTYSWGNSPGGASATSSVPQRAGEASTMLNGVPNMLP